MKFHNQSQYRRDNECQIKTLRLLPSLFLMRLEACPICLENFQVGDKAFGTLFSNAFTALSQTVNCKELKNMKCWLVAWDVERYPLGICVMKTFLKVRRLPCMHLFHVVGMHLKDFICRDQTAETGVCTCERRCENQHEVERHQCKVATATLTGHHEIEISAVVAQPMFLRHLVLDKQCPVCKTPIDIMVGPSASTTKPLSCQLLPGTGGAAQGPSSAFCAPSKSKWSWFSREMSLRRKCRSGCYFWVSWSSWSNDFLKFRRKWCSSASSIWTERRALSQKAEKVLLLLPGTR